MTHEHWPCVLTRSVFTASPPTIDSERASNDAWPFALTFTATLPTFAPTSASSAGFASCHSSSDWPVNWLLNDSSMAFTTAAGFPTAENDQLISDPPLRTLENAIF